MSILSGIRGIFGGGTVSGGPVVDFSAAPKSTDYSAYSNDKLMDCFSADWGTMDNAQRESLLREVSARYASERGVSAPVVTLDSSMNTGAMGGYRGGAIELNPKHLDNPYEALDTIIHETNHHVQEEHIKANAGDTQDNLALFACESARGGYGDGSGGGDDKIYYDMQSLEMDSNNAGFAVLAKNYDRFKSDPQYLSYLKGREQHFRELDVLYNSDQEKWKAMEKAHIEAARKSGVSDDLCDRAIRSVEYGPDEAKQKAFENAKTAKELCRNCRAEQENAQSVGVESTGAAQTTGGGYAQGLSQGTQAGARETDGQQFFRAAGVTATSDGTDWSRTANTLEQEKLLREMEANGELNVPGVDLNWQTPKHAEPHLPTEKTGQFAGERGNSAFTPSSAAARETMAQYGRSTVDYKDGHPDFSPFTHHETPWGATDAQVEIAHMTGSRENPTWEYGQRPKGSGHDPNYDIGNFAQADNELAKKLRSEYPDQEVTGEDVQKYREQNGLTWHECEDGKTMQLVPQEIHQACSHSGGVAESKERMAYGDITQPDAEESSTNKKETDEKETADKEQANGINDEKTTNDEKKDDQKETANKEQDNGINDEKKDDEKETANKEQANGINDEKTVNKDKTANKEQANGISGKDTGTSQGKGETQEIEQ